MRNTFTFGNVNSATYGVYISGSGVFNAPERDYDHKEIPGRNGDLVLGNRRLRNIDLVYPAFICSGLKNNISGLESALLSKIGYQRLTDTYNTDEFRLATYEGGLQANPIRNLHAAEFDLLFKCKPQRFLLSGETKTTITAASGSISNPTTFDSKPLITVTGYGTLTVNDMTITIENHFAALTIDSELGDCYSGSDNANLYVVFSEDVFPVLKPGNNTIAKSGNITKVEITPRWWRL